MERSSWERFTPEAGRALRLAEEAAAEMRHPHVGTEHLLLGLIQEKKGGAAKVLRRLGLHIRDVRSFLVQLGPDTELPLNDRPELTESIKRVIHMAIGVAKDRGDNKVDTEHILIAIAQDDAGMAVDILRDLGITSERLHREAVLSLKQRPVPASKLRLRGQSSETPMVDQLATDLTALARDGDLDPVIGRQTEIERVIQVLARRTKNNPALIGEPGVGKTAIVEGLAQRIIVGNAPSVLLDKRVLQLDVGSLVAGTMYRGQFEERLKKVLDELKSSDSILFIDEMHMLVGAGAAGSSVDAANILKPALARGDLQCIGATTLDEYRNHVEHDAALERRFQPIMVEEPSLEETIDILRGLVSLYEEHHQLKIADEALQSAARLAARYISDRYMPDKAVDLIDEAASRVRMYKAPEGAKLRETYEELREVAQQLKQATDQQQLDQVELLQDRSNKLMNEIKELREKWDTSQDAVVGPEDVAEVISMWTGIPLSQLEAEETQRLLKIEEELEKRIIGQREAIETIAKAIRRARAGLKDPRRPIGSFFFLGPTGVGKTELTKALAEFLFGSEDALIQLDMSEFMERHTSARLTGAPPGYVGYEDAGQLTEAIRRRPFSIVVFDEVEKAHQEVFNTFLQIMEEGTLSDARGRKVDFQNAIIIMTSNIGAEAIQRGGLGFASPAGDPEQKAEREYSEMSQTLREELKRNFRPEFINRLDAVVVFRPLGPEQVSQIVDLELDKVSQRLEEHDLSIIISQEARDLLASEGYSAEYGARPLRRVIQNTLEDPLSDAVLSGAFSSGDTVLVDVDGDELVLSREEIKQVETT
jgi:ATP-dependent Clp protease ATP-binding subunit ClpC